MLTEKLKRQFELNELLDINKNKGEEEVITEDAEFESEVRDNESNGKKSISDIIKSVEKYKCNNKGYKQSINENIEI